MTPLLVALVASGTLLVLTAVPLVLLVRRQRRAVAATSWPAWRAEARRLAPQDRRTVVRAVRRGQDVPAPLSGSAVRHGQAVLEVHAVGRRWSGRRSTRTFYAVAATFGAVALVLGVLRLQEDGWSAVRATSLVWLYLVPFLVVMASGRDVQASRMRRTRHAVDLAQRRLEPVGRDADPEAPAS